MSKAKDKTTVTIEAAGKKVTMDADKFASLAKATKARRERITQTHLPGMEPVTIPEVEEAAKAFAEAKEDQADAADISKNCEASLLVLMKREKITVYHGHGITVVVDEKSHAKVKIAQTPKRDERPGTPVE